MSTLPRSWWVGGWGVADKTILPHIWDERYEHSSPLGGGGGGGAGGGEGGDVRTLPHGWAVGEITVIPMAVGEGCEHSSPWQGRVGEITIAGGKRCELEVGDASWG